MRKTISHLADRLGDAMATLFTLLALLLIPHAVIRAIIGQALHQWTPITWLAIHTALTIAALATSLASYAITAKTGDLPMTEDQQDQLVISLDTQYAVAHAIYNRFHANGHRKHLTWENLDDDGREPWRLIAKDAITEMLASPEIGGTA